MKLVGGRFGRIHVSPSRFRLIINRRLRSTLARWVPPGDVIKVSRAAIETRANRVSRNRLPRRLRTLSCGIDTDGWHYLTDPSGAELMRTAGLEPRAVVTRCGRRDRDRFVGGRFRHFCPVCHFERVAKRRVVSWRCPECRAIGLAGHLRVERMSVA